MRTSRKFAAALGAFAAVALGLGLRARLSAVPPAGAAGTRAPASVPGASPPAKGPAARGSVGVRPQARQTSGFHEPYFDRELLGRPVVSRIYHELLDKLPPGRTSELAAVFISEGAARNGSRDFADFMTSLLGEVRASSAELLDLLTSQDAVFKQDPFVYQMALNLAFQLDLPPAEKAQALGGAMGIHFQRDPQTGVTLMTANITNSLILMKNSGVTLAQALPYIQKGVQVNQDDPGALKEFAARANAYYPGSVPGY